MATRGASKFCGDEMEGSAAKASRRRFETTNANAADGRRPSWTFGAIEALADSAACRWKRGVARGIRKGGLATLNGTGDWNVMSSPCPMTDEMVSTAGTLVDATSLTLAKS